MTVQLFWHVSRLHFHCNLQQELFGVHRRPQVKLLVQPWHREMFSETFHGLRASSSRSSSHLHQDRFAFQIATGTNITKADFPVEALRTPSFTTTEFHILLNSLFIVFFNLPSWYLFAIGLGVILRLMRSLPYEEFTEEALAGLMQMRAAPTWTGPRNCETFQETFHGLWA